MTNSTPDAAMEHAIALLTHYSFDLGSYTAKELVNRWTDQHKSAWIRSAVIEALYQGRYKAISVGQILAIWHRRGQPIYHFGYEFERIICSKLPQNLMATAHTTEPTSLPMLQADRGTHRGDRSHHVPISSTTLSLSEGTAIPPIAEFSEPDAIVTHELLPPAASPEEVPTPLTVTESTPTSPANPEPTSESVQPQAIVERELELPAQITPATSLPTLELNPDNPFEQLQRSESALTAAAQAIEEIEVTQPTIESGMLESGMEVVEPLTSETLLESPVESGETVAIDRPLEIPDIVVEAAIVPETLPAEIATPDPEPIPEPQSIVEPVRPTGKNPFDPALPLNWRWDASKHPIDQFVPDPIPDELHTKLKAVAKIDREN